MLLKPGTEEDYTKYVRINTPAGEAGEIMRECVEAAATRSGPNALPLSYSEAVVRYAEAWAEAMEGLIGQGVSVATAALNTRYTSDAWGITGFQYGCAVSALAQFWVHGEELRRWHNLDCQIGKEGESANERGAVLNPALIGIS